MNKPKQYIQGWTEFYKLKFKVTPDVLIPRPETELLVDEVLYHLSKLSTTNYQPPTILDVGTGSGAIAISIAKHLPAFQVGTQIIASDVSEKALKIARQNAKLHGVADKITFIKSDLLSDISLTSISGVHPRGGILNDKTLQDLVIVANLPYIPTERISHLDSSVKDFEPHIALNGGFDGFELYRKLFKQIAKLSLPPQGWTPKLLAGEIDYTHGELAVLEAQKYFPEARVEVKLDLAHKQRVLIINF